MCGTSVLDFGSRNFANNIFNGSSVLGTVGISMVDGVKVTGINILPNNQVYVNLMRTSPITKTSLPRSVTASVLVASISHQDITSIIAAAATTSNMANRGNSVGNSPLNALQGYGSDIGGGNATTNFNPFSFLNNIHIGSSSLVNAIWNLPQTIVMGLTGNLLPSSAADFIIVTVIPYTGVLIQVYLILLLQQLHWQLHCLLEIILSKSTTYVLLRHKEKMD
jgi:hypothetical protein